MSRISEMHSLLPIKVGTSNKMHDRHLMGLKLRMHSHKGFASDMENFDTSVSTVFIQKAAIVDKVIYDRCSAPGEDVAKGNTIRTHLHAAVEDPMIISRKEVLRMLQGMVSGCPDTAIKNSKIVWALYFIVWCELAIENGFPELATWRAFKKAVCLIVYGDDNACTVKDGYEWFNFNTFKEKSKKYGFTITDINKTGGKQPDYVPFEELEFLKRTFSMIQGWHVGPLSKHSIGKSIAWSKGPSSYEVNATHVPSLGGKWPMLQDSAAIAEHIAALFPEMALHGKQQYELWCQELIDQTKNTDILVQPPLWQEAASQLGYYFV